MTPDPTAESDTPDIAKLAAPPISEGSCYTHGNWSVQIQQIRPWHDTPQVLLEGCPQCLVNEAYSRGFDNALQEYELY